MSIKISELTKKELQRQIEKSITIPKKHRCQGFPFLTPIDEKEAEISYSVPLCFSVMKLKSKYIVIERKLSIDDIVEKSKEFNGYNEGYVPHRYYVASVKDRVLREDIIKVINKLEEKANKMRELHPNKPIVRLVETPLSYCDVRPGDTTLHYFLLTKQSFRYL